MCVGSSENDGRVLFGLHDFDGLLFTGWGLFFSFSAELPVDFQFVENELRTTHYARHQVDI